MIHELRLYRTNPGRLPALLARFQDHALPLWEKHGVRQAGFFTTLVGASSNDLTYMLEWQSLAEREQRWEAFMADPAWARVRIESQRGGVINANVSNSFLVPTAFSAVRPGQPATNKGNDRAMIYELRVYRTIPGRLPALLSRFQNHTLKLWEKHGIRQAGFWTTLVGESNNDLTYLLAWESLAEREQKWNAFATDPDWLKVRAETEADGPINQTVMNAFLSPTAFSSVK